MSRCVFHLVALLAATAALATGCRGTRGGGLTRPTAAESSTSARRVSAHTHYAAAVIHQMNGENAAALEDFVLAARCDPGDEDLILEVSGRLLRAGEFNRAVELLLPAVSRRDASGPVYLRLAAAYSQLGETQKAVEANRAALERMPGSLSPYQNLFVSFVQTRQAGAALAILDEAAAQPQADPEYLIHLAELYATCGAQFPELRQSARSRAVAALNRAAPARELSPALRLKLADGLNLLGDNEQAAAAYLYLVNQPDLSPPLRELLRAKLADLYLRERDPRQAVAQLEAIVRDNPANSAAYYFLGRIALEQKQWTNAVDHFQKMILFNPELEQAHYDLAAAQLALDRAEDAAATLEAARKRFPPGFAAEYLLGVTEHARKRYAEAVNHLTSAEHLAQSAGETNRLNHGFYFQLGASFERKGDRAAAEKHFEKALLLAPDDPETLNYLGYMWAERGENLDRALAMIERAVKSDPTNAAFLDSLGWVLFQLGRPGEAVEYLLQSIAHDEKPDATVLDHLGDVYAALKEWSKAREAWTRSLSVEASDLVRKKLESAPAP